MKGRGPVRFGTTNNSRVQQFHPRLLPGLLLVGWDWSGLEIAWFLAGLDFHIVDHAVFYLVGREIVV